MDLVVTGLVGLGGVLIGGALAGFIELWRQLLEGRAAARILRMEIQENVNRALLSVAHFRSDIALKDDAWKDLRAKVVPLLPEVFLLQLSISYDGMFVVRNWIDKAALKQERAKAIAQVREWTDNMMWHATFLIQLRQRRRIAQLVDLLLGRPTFPPPVKGEPGMEKQLSERKKKVMEMFEKGDEKE